MQGSPFHQSLSSDKDPPPISYHSLRSSFVLYVVLWCCHFCCLSYDASLALIFCCVISLLRFCGPGDLSVVESFRRKICCIAPGPERIRYLDINNLTEEDRAELYNILHLPRKL